MRRLLGQLALMGALFVWLPVMAADIPSDCLQSLNVKDKGFTMDAQSFSCVQVERRRADLFSTINALPATGNFDANAIAQEMKAAQDQITKIEGTKNWADIAELVGGHFLATVGLIGCADTLGLGCALGVAGKALAMEQTIRMAVNDAQRATEAEKLRAQIAVWQNQIKGTSPPAKPIRDKLVEEFTGLCKQVKQNCL